MLDRIRKRSDSFIYSIIILGVVAVMAMYGMDQFTRGSNADQQSLAATVNGEAITQQEFQREMENLMADYQARTGQAYNEKLLYALQIPQRILGDLIKFKLMSQKAKDLEFTVSDAELADFIRSIPYFQKKGKFDSETYLKIPNRGSEEFRWRERLGASRFQSYLSDRIRLTPEAVRVAYQMRNAKMEIEFAQINFDEIAKKTKPTTKEISTYLLHTPDEELNQYYQAHLKDYTKPGAYEFRQIRAGFPFQATDAQKQDAHKKIVDAAKGLSAENFEKTAQQKSDDEYAKKGGQVGWMDQGVLEPPLEKALEALTPGAISQPVETSFGYFVVQLLAKREPTVTALKDVKPKIAEALLHERQSKQLSTELKTKWEKMVSEGKSLDAELKSQRVELKKTGPFSLAEGYVPQIGQSDTVLDEVYNLTPKDKISRKLAYHQNNYYYLKLLSFTPAKSVDYKKEVESVDAAATSALQGDFINQLLNGLEKNSKINKLINFETTES